MVTEAKFMLERELKAEVLKAARKHGWLTFHVTNSWNGRSSQIGEGFPDVTLARGGCVIFIECKREGKDLEPAQEVWRDAIGATSPTLRWLLVRPSDLPTIDEVLR